MNAAAVVRLLAWASARAVAGRRVVSPSTELDLGDEVRLDEHRALAPQGTSGLLVWIASRRFLRSQRVMREAGADAADMDEPVALPRAEQRPADHRMYLRQSLT